MAATEQSNPFDTQQEKPTNGGLINNNLPEPNKVTTYAPQTRQVNAQTETVQGQVNSILSKDSPLMQRARTLATQGMAQRGLVNSSMNQGAGVAAMTDRALPMAQQDAQTYAVTASENMNATNRANEFGAGAINQFGLQKGAQEFEANQSNINRQFTTSERLGSQSFTSTLENARQNFTAAQAQLDRAQQTALADKSIEAQQALQVAQQNFAAAQSALDRTQQTSLQREQQSFQAGQSALDRNQQTNLQTSQQNFTAAQSALDRAQQAYLQDKSAANQMALQKAQNDFNAAQSALDRTQQVTLVERQAVLQKDLTNFQQQFSAAQSALDRAQQAYLQDKSAANQMALQKAQNDFAASQSALDRTQQEKMQNDQQAHQVAVTQMQQSFTAAQAGLDRQQQAFLQDDAQAFQKNLTNSQIPANFALQISSTTASSINAIGADPNLSGKVDGTAPAGSSPKSRAIASVINYANSQIAWANKFYGTTIPGLPTG